MTICWESVEMGYLVLMLRPTLLPLSFSQIKRNYVILSHINTQNFIFILQET